MNAAISSSTRSLVAKWSSRAIDGGVLLCLFAAPLCFGGRHDLGRFAYVFCVAITAGASATLSLIRHERPKRWSYAHSILVAAIVLVALQLVPIPHPWLVELAPSLKQLLPLWNDNGAGMILGEWNTLSVNPGQTRIGLAVLMAHSVLFWVVFDRLTDSNKIRRLLVAIGIASATMAAFGLLQWLTSNGKLLWVYSHPQREIGSAVQGSFANKNHFAHFLVLGFAPALTMWLHVSSRSEHNKKKEATKQQKLELVAWHVAIGMIATAIVFSLSRGGLLAFAAAVKVALVYLARTGKLKQQLLWGLLAFATTALLAVSFGDYTQVANRYDDLAGGTLEDLDARGSRRLIWAANLSAVAANPWFGFGAGSHPDVYHAFILEGRNVEFTHAESGYLNIATETGLMGSALLILGVLVASSWCVRGWMYESDHSRLSLWAAVAAGLVASGVHSTCDFVWYVPACMTLTILLLACALRLHQLRFSSLASTKGTKTFHWSPHLAAPLLAAVALAILWGPCSASIAWDRYLRASVRHRELMSSKLQVSASFESTNEEMVELLQLEMIDALQTVVRQDPSNARARMRLAGRLLQQFGNEQRNAPNALGLVHIREAAIASKFPSQQATIDWLQRAYGDSAQRLVSAYSHTRAALQAAPAQADGYAYLAELSFLSPPDQRDISALIDQAVRLRPKDGAVLYSAGKHLMTIGQVEQAVEYWKESHKLPGSHQLLIAANIASFASADAYLTDFDPDWKLLNGVYRIYQEKGGSEADLRAIGYYARQFAEQPIVDQRTTRQCAGALSLASLIHRQLGEPAEAICCAEQAVELSPTSVSTRYALAAAYISAEQFDAALSHVRWCLARRPTNQKLQVWLEQAQKNRLEVARGTSASSH